MGRLNPGGGWRRVILKQLVFSGPQLVLREGWGARPRGPGQARGHLALVRASGAPARRHGGEGRVWVVAEGVRCLQGQGLDAVGQQATGGIVILIGQVQLVGARLLDRGDEPALGRGRGTDVLTLRGEEAVGLGYGPFTRVKAVLRQVVDKLVLKERLHGVAGPRHDLGGARGVCRRRSQPVILWGRVHPVPTNGEIENTK